MAMKKTFGGDSPLQQGARKSFWTPQSRVDDGGRSRCVFGKLIGCLGFSCWGVFIGKGQRQKWPGGPHHRAAWLGTGPCPWW
jgi:hypothetical protein